MGIDPITHRPRTDHLDMLANLPHLLAVANNLGINIPMNPWQPEFNSLRPQFSDVTQLAKLQLIQNLLQVLSPTNTTNPIPSFGNTTTTTLPIFQDNLQLNEYLKHNFNINNNNNSNNTHFDINNIVPNSLSPNNNIISPPAEGVQLDHVMNFGNNYCSNSSSLPALLPAASPECRRRSGVINGGDQMGNEVVKANNIDMMSTNPSSTCTNFDAFGDHHHQLMDDGASEAYWRDFIE